jgi:hypothetical protein
MTGQQFWESVRDGDTTKVVTVLSTHGAQSFIVHCISTYRTAGISLEIVKDDL